MIAFSLQSWRAFPKAEVWLHLHHLFSLTAFLRHWRMRDIICDEQTITTLQWYLQASEPRQDDT